MTEDEKKLKIATFRFGLISEFVTGVRLHHGEKEKLIKEKIARGYDIPFSSIDRVARSTLEKWVCDYKKAGYRLDGLMPKERTDKGKTRALSDHIKLAIKEIRKDEPKIHLPAMIKKLRHKKLIAPDEVLTPSTVHRYLRAEKLNSVNEEAKDKRLFEASHPNEIWQSDVMHGPIVKHDGKQRKSYLIAIIDDHSRLIIHAEFYLSETLKSFLDCLRLGIMTRGLPQKLYIDNGSCYKALHLEQVAAQLGIGISHSRPYIPQGRGKIERWFKYVRENFLAAFEKGSDRRIEKLDLLNHHFSEWVEEYNNRAHGTTKQTPYYRYRSNLECARPAPKELLDYFRAVEFRRVKKDRTVRLQGKIFEVPVQLIERQVELRFHPENLSEVEVYFSGQSFGFGVVVNPHLNSKIGRSWGTEKAKYQGEIKEEQLDLPLKEIATGRLFESQNGNEEKV